MTNNKWISKKEKNLDNLKGIKKRFRVKQIDIIIVENFQIFSENWSKLYTNVKSKQKNAQKSKTITFFFKF